MKYRLWVEVEGREGQGYYRGPEIEIDGIPYPGVSIGAMTVKEVYLWQGWYPNSSEIQLQAITQEHGDILDPVVWKWNDSE